MSTMPNPEYPKTNVPSGMALRRATIEDLPILTSIHAEGFANYWDTNAFNDFFGIKNTISLICETTENGTVTPMGMLVFRYQYEQSDIITVAVRNQYRRRGIARTLIGCAMHVARENGATEMFLDVEDGNIAALQLYESFGFKQINRRKLYYRQKDSSYTDALVMRCKLA